MKPVILSCALWVVGVGLTASNAAADMVVQACFSPQGRCAAHVLREITSAKKELLVAVYAFTSSDLANALIQAKKRGVAVQIVIDRDFDLANQNSKGKFFDAQKIPLRRISGTKPRPGEKESGLMHQKFAIVDRNVVLSGSYNWTYAAEALNDENLLVFHDAAPLAEEYRRAFLRLWERKP